MMTKLTAEEIIKTIKIRLTIAIIKEITKTIKTRMTAVATGIITNEI